MTRFEYVKTADGFYACPHCNEKKRLISTMNMHYHARHDGTFKHKCKHCTYETSTKQALDNHIFAKHPTHCKEPVKEILCKFPNCDYKTHKKVALRSHTLLKHLSDDVEALCDRPDTTKEVLCCTACGDQFKSKPAFVYHVVSCLPPDLLQESHVAHGLCI